MRPSPLAGGGGFQAVFLDRDGTLNREKGYLHDWKDWEWLPGVPGALARLNAAGFRLVVVSNQSGMARGYYGEAEWLKLNGKIDSSLAATGARIDGYYFCPHHPAFTGPCDCRKPGPGLILRAAEDLEIDLSASWLVGDKASDIAAGLAAGCRPILVLSGYGMSERCKTPPSVPVCAGLAEAAELIIGGSEQEGGTHA